MNPHNRGYPRNDSCENKMASARKDDLLFYIFYIDIKNYYSHLLQTK